MKIQNGPLNNKTFFSSQSTYRLKQGVAQSGTAQSVISPAKSSCFSKTVGIATLPLRLPFIALFSYGKSLGKVIKKQTLTRDCAAICPQSSPFFWKLLALVTIFPVIATVHFVNWVFLAYYHLIGQANIKNIDANFGRKILSMFGLPLFAPVVTVVALVEGAIKVARHVFRSRESELLALLASDDIHRRKPEALAELLIEIDTYPRESELHEAVGKKLNIYHNFIDAKKIKEESYRTINAFCPAGQSHDAFLDFVQHFHHLEARKFSEKALKVPSSVRELEGTYNNEWIHGILGAAIRQQNLKAVLFLFPFQPRPYEPTLEEFAKLREFVSDETLAKMFSQQTKKLLLDRAIVEGSPSSATCLTTAPYKVPFNYSVLKNGGHSGIGDLAYSQFETRTDFSSPSYLQELSCLLNAYPTGRADSQLKILDNPITAAGPESVKTKHLVPFVQAASYVMRLTYIDFLLARQVPKDLIKAANPQLDQALFDWAAHWGNYRCLALIEEVRPKELKRDKLIQHLDTALDANWDEVEKILGGFTQDLVAIAFSNTKSSMDIPGPAVNRLIQFYGLRPEFKRITNRNLAYLCSEWLLKHPDDEEGFGEFLTYQGLTYLPTGRQREFLNQRFPKRFTVDALRPFFIGENDFLVYFAAQKIFDAPLSKEEKIALFKALFPPRYLKEFSECIIGETPFPRNKVEILAKAKPELTLPAHSLTKALSVRDIISLRAAFPNQVDFSDPSFQEYLINLKEENEVEALIFNGDFKPLPSAARAIGRKFPGFIPRMLARHPDLLYTDTNDQEGLMGVLVEMGKFEEVEALARQGYKLGPLGLWLFCKMCGIKRAIGLYRSDKLSDDDRGQALLHLLYEELMDEEMIAYAKEFFEAFKQRGPVPSRLKITGGNIPNFSEEDEKFFIELLKAFPPLCESKIGKIKDGGPTEPLVIGLILRERFHHFLTLAKLRPAVLKQTDSLGRLPAHYAASMGNMEASTLAAFFGTPDQMFAKDKQGVTPYLNLVLKGEYAVLDHYHATYPSQAAPSVPEEFRSRLAKALFHDSSLRDLVERHNYHFRLQTWDPTKDSPSEYIVKDIKRFLDSSPPFDVQEAVIRTVLGLRNKTYDVMGSSFPYFSPQEVVDVIEYFREKIKSDVLEPLDSPEDFSEDELETEVARLEKIATFYRFIHSTKLFSENWEPEITEVLSSAASELETLKEQKWQARPWNEKYEDLQAAYNSEIIDHLINRWQIPLKPFPIGFASGQTEDEAFFAYNFGISNDPPFKFARLDEANIYYGVGLQTYGVDETLKNLIDAKAPDDVILQELDKKPRVKGGLPPRFSLSAEGAKETLKETEMRHNIALLKRVIKQQLQK